MEVFRCPFLDILREVENKVGPIDFDAIPDDSDAVLHPFRKADTRFVFFFEFPQKSALYGIVLTEKLKQFWIDPEKFDAILRDNPVRSFDEVVHISTLRDPTTPDRSNRLMEFLRAKG